MKTLITSAILAVATLVPVLGTSEAKAHDYIGGGYGWSGGYSSGYGGYSGGYGGYSYTQPIYHGPSVHLDPVYHATSSHWTPSQGWHTHGHIDYVPHYTPGHFDTLHNGHIHTNPWFHH